MDDQNKVVEGGNSSMTIEAVNDVLDKGSDVLGFRPFINPELSKDGSFVKVTCPFCGTDTQFTSLDDLNQYSEIEHGSLKDTRFPINVCPYCVASRKKTYEKMVAEKKNFPRYANEAAKIRLSEIVSKMFGAVVLATGRNLFVDPDEIILFKKDDKKYRIKYKILLNYSDISFEDVEYDEDDLYAKIDGSDEFVYIEDLLLNKERDSIYEVHDPDEDGSEEIDETKEEESIEESEEESDGNEEDVDMTEPETNDEIVEESDDIEGTKITNKEGSKGVTCHIISDETMSSDKCENEADIIQSPQSVMEREYMEKEEESDESEEEVDMTEPETDEIVEEDIKIEEVESSEDVEENEITDETIREVSETESEDDNIIDIETDDEKPFDIVFEDGKDKEKVDFLKREKEFLDSVKEQETEKNNDEVVLDLDDGESVNPFHSASETNEVKESPVISEAKRFDTDKKKDELDIDEEDDSFDSSEDDIIIDLDSKLGSNKKKEKEPEETYANHIDRINDEARKIEAKDKKWYDNIVFSEEDDQTPINEFMDEEDLYKEFLESALGRTMIKVKERTGVDAKFTINEMTYELPFVDFASGVRIICIDCDNMAQMKVPVAFIEKQVKFQFPLPKGYVYRKLYLYTDSLNTPKRAKATVQNICKVVNREHFDPRRIVNLSGNYTLFYTDHIPTIRAFEEDNSSYPQGKPCTKSIGIIALRPNSGKKQNFNVKDFMNYLSKNYRANMESDNLYTVATARYIVRPDHATKTVKYQITEYNEMRQTILRDGLDHIVGAIIKEHMANNTVKDPRNIGMDFSSYKYEFEFEFDPATIPSPSLEIWNDNADFFKTMDSFEDGQGKCYIRTPEYRSSPADGYRNDPRLFLPIPLSKRFKADIEKAGMNILIDSVRRQFIERIGFIEAYYPRIKRFMLNPLTVMKLAYQSSVLTMSKVDLERFFSGSNIYDGCGDNILMQKMLMNKMNDTDMDENTKKFMNLLMIQKMYGSK